MANLITTQPPWVATTAGCRNKWFKLEISLRTDPITDRSLYGPTAACGLVATRREISTNPDRPASLCQFHFLAKVQTEGCIGKSMSMSTRL